MWLRRLSRTRWLPRCDLCRRNCCRWHPTKTRISSGRPFPLKRKIRLKEELCLWSIKLKIRWVLQSNRNTKIIFLMSLGLVRTTTIKLKIKRRIKTIILHQELKQRKINLGEMKNRPINLGHGGMTRVNLSATQMNTCQRDLSQSKVKLRWLITKTIVNI
jgi:hypothetical protein